MAVLFALFKWEQKKRVEAEVDAKDARYEAMDGVLEQKQKNIADNLEQAKKDLDSEKAKQLSQEEMTEYLKKL